MGPTVKEYLKVTMAVSEFYDMLVNAGYSQKELRQILRSCGYSTEEAKDFEVFSQGDDHD